MQKGHSSDITWTNQSLIGQKGEAVNTYTVNLCKELDATESQDFIIAYTFKEFSFHNRILQY
jgi:hypothetical protein